MPSSPNHVTSGFRTAVSKQYGRVRVKEYFTCSVDVHLLRRRFISRLLCRAHKSEYVCFNKTNKQANKLAMYVKKNK